VSYLTKVFVLVVSILSIFLCGVVVTYVASSQNWHQAYMDQKGVVDAAMASADTASIALKRQDDRYSLLVKALKENISALERQNSELLQQKTVESKRAFVAESSANTAVETVKSLRETITNMYAGQQYIESKLQSAQAEMLAAQGQATDLTRELNSERAKSQQLARLSRERLEKIQKMEDENTQIRQQLQKVTLGPSEFTQGEKVTQIRPQDVGVPIRGAITAIDSDLAAISIGSTSGVRKDMKFIVVRDQKYLGDLIITRVEATEAAGRISHQQAPITAGDAVTTSLN
jgi:hypothetical protein